MSTVDDHRAALEEQFGHPLESSVEAVLADLAFALGWLDIKSRELEGQLRLQQEMGQLQSKIGAELDRLRAQRDPAEVLRLAAAAHDIRPLLDEDDPRTDLAVVLDQLGLLGEQRVAVLALCDREDRAGSATGYGITAAIRRALGVTA